MSRKLLTVLFCVLPAAAQEAPLNFAGLISGTIKGDDGSSIAGAYLSLQLQPPYPNSRSVQTEWTAQTGSDGSFQFDRLNSGSYRLCSYVPHGVWLNPCAWGLHPPMFTLSGTQPVATVTLTLKKGAAVPIRINDPGQLLSQYESKSPGADLLIGVASDSRVFLPALTISRDGGGRNHQIVIPFDSTVNLVVFSPQFQLSSGGVPLPKASIKIPITVPSGRQPPIVTLQVTGRNTL
ncbi:MAG: hypothetical protein C5B51_28730 [Terriglobia bacterium]|nr:MAG: hypothetical protein C5B51_28730 [Terriglobia bacterium]